MRFWDTSALVPLLIKEKFTIKTKSWLHEDAAIVVWTLTPIEIISALQRRYREGIVDMQQLMHVTKRADELIASCRMVIDVEKVKPLAVRLLCTHSLKAADALQLAAALVWAGEPTGRVFHTFDKRLADAAFSEGFVTNQ
ncbi:MAG: type II toxin-antitoxin system VapC family toxin [Deltaproteobacteria bacterium]|nr:type II toxin-antitoxin system VapC family toxin [Deltaproteobacteria bacterium]